MPYWNHIIPSVHRLFGNLDRTPGSPFEGSMSREVWHYRFGERFHPATRQCFFYPLARLYEESIPENPFVGNPEVLQSIRTILAFTVSLQNRDGSFPEWHRGQSSYCSTAYLSAYLSETLLRLRRELDEPIRESAVRSLGAAARRLARPPSGIPSNQLAAGILALRNCTALLGGSWNHATLALRDRLLVSAGEGGWFPEYGGPDLGYQTLTLDFLTRCAYRGLDGLVEPIGRGISFLDRFVMPDGTAPPGLSWRGTAFLMPYALERWAPVLAPAADLSRRVRSALEQGRIPSPSTVDDRYAAHLFLPSFVDAQFARNPADPPCASVTTPCREPTGPEDGGLRAFLRDAYVCVLQARTGAVSVFSRKTGKVVLDGPAYRLITLAGTFCPSPSEDFRGSGGPEYRLYSSFRAIRGEGGWARMGAALLPVIATILGRIHHGIPERIDSFVRDYVFGPGREAPVSLRRSIVLSDGSIRIRDSIAHRSSTPRGTLHCTFRAVPSLHPSSGFFTRHELDGTSAKEEGISEAVRMAWESVGAVDLEIDIGFDSSGIRLRCRVNGKEIWEEAPLAGLPG